MNRKGFVLSAALVLASPAYGEDVVDVMIFDNAAGGISVMTNQLCGVDGRVIKATDNRGIVGLRGCLTPISLDYARVNWEDGTEAYFNMRLGVSTEAYIRWLREETAKIKARTAKFYEHNSLRARH
jgi:opacity protein-like surface antigen